MGELAADYTSWVLAAVGAGAAAVLSVGARSPWIGEGGDIFILLNKVWIFLVVSLPQNY